MNKPNYLYGIIGLLAGLIVGYIGTNYINQTNRPVATAGGGAASSTTLPPNHPPTGDSSGAAASGSPEIMMSSGSGSESGGSGAVKWTTPARWKAGPPKQMRTATYLIPAATGDSEEAECAVFTNIGGGVQANIDRWVGQFEKTDAAPIQKQETINSLNVTMVDVSGTFSSGGSMMGQPNVSKPGYRMLAAIADGPEGAVYFKLTGPGKTVAAAQSEFQAMLKSLKK